MVDVSLCALFLLQISKQVDEQMRTPHRSSYHTVSDAKGDIRKLALHMLESDVLSEVESRNTPSFEDPVDKGMEKIRNGWLADFISKTPTEIDSEFDIDDVVPHVDVDIDYELYD